MASTPAPSTAVPLWSQVTGFQRAMVMVGAIMTIFMQVLDTTIANVALPHMRADLGATTESVTWVLTSYLVASAIAIPITGWLADKIGRKPLFVIATVAFTAASALCAIATSLPEIVTFRIIQGISGAFIVPLGQAIMLDINRPEKTARAMAIFGMGTLVGPVVGPLLGGFLTENFNWRWVFLVNVPVGVLCMFIMLRYLPRTEKSERRFDLFGFALLAIALGALQMMLDRGQQQDWFDSWEVWIECGLVLATGWMFLIHLFTTKDPIFDPVVFTDRNYSMTLLFSMVLGMVILAGAALLPSLLQGLMGYSVFQSGMLATPRAIGSLVAMLVATRLGKVDVRVMILIGSLIMTGSLWGMTGYALDMDQRLVVITGLTQGFGMGLCFVPITVLAFATISPHLRTSAASIMTLSRSLGGSIGISIATTVLARNVQTSHSDLASHVTTQALPPVDPSVIGMAGGSGGEMAMAMIDAEINRQAAMIAYIDDFQMMMIASVVMIPLILLLRKPAKTDTPDQRLVME